MRPEASDREPILIVTVRVESLCEFGCLRRDRWKFADKTNLPKA